MTTGSMSHFIPVSWFLDSQTYSLISPLPKRSSGHSRFKRKWPLNTDVMEVCFIIMAQGTLISSSRLKGQWDVMFSHPHAYYALAGRQGSIQISGLGLNVRRGWERCAGQRMYKGQKMNREWLWVLLHGKLWHSTVSCKKCKGTLRKGRHVWGFKELGNFFERSEFTYYS